MKIKTDFITNSSSSSFIVVFDEKITKLSDLHCLYERESKTQQVLKDALRQRPTKIVSDNEKIINIVAEELSHGYIDDTMSYSDYQDNFCKREDIEVKDLYDNRAWQQAFYREYEAIQMKLCSKAAIKFLEQHDGKYMYIFNYGDEDGEFMSEMEHGGTFRGVSHLAISKH